jgi:hypothetical protein
MPPDLPNATDNRVIYYKPNTSHRYTVETMSYQVPPHLWLNPAPKRSPEQATASSHYVQTLFDETVSSWYPHIPQTAKATVLTVSDHIAYDAATGRFTIKLDVPTRQILSHLLAEALPLPPPPSTLVRPQGIDWQGVADGVTDAWASALNKAKQMTDAEWRARWTSASTPHRMTTDLWAVTYGNYMREDHKEDYISVTRSNTWQVFLRFRSSSVISAEWETA